MPMNFKRVAIYTPNSKMDDFSANEAHLIDFGFLNYAQLEAEKELTYLLKIVASLQKEAVRRAAV